MLTVLATAVPAAPSPDDIKNAVSAWEALYAAALAFWTAAQPILGWILGIAGASAHAVAWFPKLGNALGGVGNIVAGNYKGATNAPPK